MITNAPLWSPSPAHQSTMADFLRAFAARHAIEMDGDWAVDYARVHEFSIQQPALFWDFVRTYCNLIAHSWQGPVMEERAGPFMRAAWYPKARLNYAETMLRHRGNTDALVFWSEPLPGENPTANRRTLSHDALHEQVCRLRQALIKLGIKPGDCVAGYLPNIPEAIIAMLACASIGAVWSSCSPDFGVAGILDRWDSLQPKVLFAADGYVYGGKIHQMDDKVKDVQAALGECLCTVICIPYKGDRADFVRHTGASVWDDVLADSPYLAGEPFASLPFNHPLLVLFSSGTTGKPKGIIHGQGGTLIQHAKEHRLHCDIQPQDRVFFFTTCGWMMWNWLVSVLGTGATVVLYDGSPFAPHDGILFDLAQAEKLTFMGVSAKYIDAINKAGLKPQATHDLRALRTIASTGSPLSAQGFHYVYDHVKKDVFLTSISGGTDIVSCFLLGSPVLPVRAGEIQVPGLGMAIEILDDNAHPVATGPGELTCTKPFPSMPVGFLNDPNDQRYQAAYFERFGHGIWHHGDFVERTEHGGYVIHGRSDATLNPGGVRIGTAEIYRQLEQIPAIQESVVVGQEWEGDTRVILFVVLHATHTLDDALIAHIKTRIKTGCSPRHVPKKVIAVEDIPRTRSNKISELAVRAAIHGKEMGNTEALQNPQSLAFYRDIPALRH